MTIRHIDKEYQFQKNTYTQCNINKRSMHVVNRRRLFFSPSGNWPEQYCILC